MNMFLHELKAYRKSTLIWAFSMSALIILFMSMYPDFSKNSAELTKLLEGYPESVRKALGANVEIFFTVLGFYSYIFMYVVLSGAIQAMNLGLSIISKEVRDKTADFLLTKPITRSQIISSKLLAVLVSLIFTNVIYLIAASFIISAIKQQPVDMKIFFMISITLFFVQLIFAAIGIFIAVVFSKIRSVISISVGAVFVFFIINMFDSVIGDKSLRYITPFKYYDAQYIIKNGSYENAYMLTELVIVISIIMASYYIYSRKDIHAV